jgi:hypothetical protein
MIGEPPPALETRSLSKSFGALSVADSIAATSA